jgi:putative PEP-CTERM system TPR-repeat lipoprotein
MTRFSMPQRGARLALSTLALATSLAWGANAGRYYDDALNRYAKEDLSGAIVQLKNAIQEDPKMLAAHLLLGKALLRTGDIKAAEGALEQAQALGVARSEVVVPLGQVYLILGENRKIIDNLGTEGLSGHTLAEVLTLRGSAFAMQGNRALAAQSFEQARRAAPEAAAPLLAESRLKLRSGDIAAAKAGATRATELEPKSATAWNNLGAVLRAAGDAPGALAAFDRALALDKGHVDAIVSKAGLLALTGRDAEAVKTLDILKEGGLLDPRASYLRASLAARKGDSKAAQQAFNDVIEQADILPVGVVNGDEAILIATALSQQALGNAEKARERVKSLLTLAPKHFAGQLLMASLLIDAREYSQAQPILDGLLRDSPNDSSVLNALGRLYLGRKNYQQASEYFEKSLSKNASPLALRDLGLSQLGLGNDKRGIELLENALTQNPKDVGTMMRLSMLYAQQGQNDKARKMAEAAVQADPGNFTLHSFLGNIRGRLGDKKGARESFEGVLKLEPKFLPAAINLNWLDIEEGRFAAARTRLGELLKENNRDAGLLFQLGVLEFRAGRANEALEQWEQSMNLAPTDTRAGLAMIDALQKQGENARALTVAKSLAAKNNGDVPVLVALGQASLANGDAQRARGTFRDASRLVDLDADRLVLLGRLLLAANGVEDASYNAQKALQAKPNDLGALALQVEIEFKRGDKTRAEAALKNLNAKHPDNLLTHTVNGHAAMGRGQFAAAAESYRTVFNRAPSTPNAILLAHAQLASGQAATAVAGLADWSRKQPQDRNALLALAEVQSEAGMAAESKQSFARLAQAEPNNASLWTKYADALLKTRDPAAKQAAEKAVQLAPSNPEALATLGTILVQQGQIEAGVNHLREARLRAPSAPEFRLRLAAGLSRLDRKAEAREELKAALGLAPGLAGRPDVQALRQHLGQ